MRVWLERLSMASKYYPVQGGGSDSHAHGNCHGIRGELFDQICNAVDSVKKRFSPTLVSLSLVFVYIYLA